MNPMTKMIEALKAEVEMNEQSYRLVTEQTSRLIADYAGKAPSSHFGHNLAARAAELSVIAGKLETARGSLRYAMTLQEMSAE